MVVSTEANDIYDGQHFNEISAAWLPPQSHKVKVHTSESLARLRNKQFTHLVPFRKDLSSMYLLGEKDVIHMHSCSSLSLRRTLSPHVSYFIGLVRNPTSMPETF